ncbi:hypoxanthine-DNA glycosylase [Lysobacter niastensis]|uniref:Hypoxanthine-DNA glycosylase n=1 Tax=Lysobacter niastensis TaxID=380629 RepID=A0ABU1W9H0_9GAMM|nr:DNA-deoxyinosine glycosylase [Lysobacter niastensis]MDR7134256.1 hypoxanthine-DNA glycosylase [Lysobacter niastensis]
MLQGFAPVVGQHARVLILGSMPGAASLLAAQYYAHPRNQFWPIMGELVGADPALPYAQRLDRLTAAGIALWDVLARCEREGSLDARIRDDTAIANDFAGFFASQPGIRTVLLNGGKAEQSFRRIVLPTLAVQEFACVRLPSTSPAHASLRAEQKRQAWREALRAAGIATAR